MVINCEKNGRQGTARNIGLTYATALYIGFVDSDDWVETDMYQRLYEAMDKNDCDMVLCGFVRDDGTAVPMKGGGERIVLFDNDEKISDNIALFNMPEAMWNTLSKKSFLDDNEIRFIEGKKYEDMLFIELTHIYARKICILEAQLYHYYLNNDSTTLRRGIENHLDSFESAIISHHHCRQRAEYKLYKDAIDMVFIRFFYFQGLKTLAYRIDNPDVGMFRWMCETLNETLPDWRENSYVKTKLNGFYESLLRFVDLKINNDDFMEFLEMIRKATI